MYVHVDVCEDDKDDDAVGLDLTVVHRGLVLGGVTYWLTLHSNGLFYLIVCV